MMRSSTICIGISTFGLAASFVFQFAPSACSEQIADGTASGANIGAANKSAQVDDLLNQARRKEKASQWAMAISLYRQAVRLDSSNPACTGGLVECWRNVVKLAPNAVGNRLGLGEALELHEAFEEAEREYKLALQLDPNSELAKKKLARLPDVRKRAGSLKLLNSGVDLQESGQLDKAVEQYLQALQVTPEDPLVWLNLASCYQAMNKLDKSKEAYNKVLALKSTPDDVRKSAEEGLSLISGEISVGDFNQSHQKAIELFNSGNYAAATKQFESILTSFKQELEGQPVLADVYYNLAMACDRTGNKDKAIASYKKALDLGCKQPSLKSSLTNAYAAIAENKMKAQDFAGAAASYRQLLEIEPNNYQVWFNMAGSLYKTKQTGAAIQAFLKSASFNPKYAKGLFWAAQIEAETGQVDKAKSHYQQFIARGSDPQLIQSAKDSLANLNESKQITGLP